MTTIGHDVELWGRYRQLKGWKSVRISADLTKACREFELEAIDINLPVADPPGNPILIRPMDPVQLYAGTDIVVSGYVDRIKIKAAKTETGINISGRSITEDIVDCVNIASPDEWRNKTFLQIATALCERYSVEVVAEVTEGITDTKIGRFRIRRGEKVFQALDRLARKRSVMLTDDEQGRLVITRAGAVRSETKLSLGDNVIESDFDYDASGLYSLIHCRGWQPPEDNDSADIIAVFSEASEDAVNRPRILEVMPEGRATRENCQRRAQTEAMARSGRSIDGTIKVMGWRQNNGELWRPNLLVQYRDTVQGIKADLLIVSVDFTLSLDEGEVCTMRLAPPEAYELLPPKTKRVARGQRGTGVGIFAALDELAIERSRPRIKKDKALQGKLLSSTSKGVLAGLGE
jgi:prophage tail gpP-like protein